MTAERFGAAFTFDEYLQIVEKNRDWWQAAWRTARVDEAALARARALSAPRYLLALSEDWCGDAVNSLPYIARLAEAVPQLLELRVLLRDDNPDIMDVHMTGPARAIPVVIALDAEFREYGWWGPRPCALQELALGEWKGLPKDERRVKIRTFYARDRGRLIMDEVLRLLEGADRTP